MAPFTALEIFQAMFAINDNKTPGPDGCTSAFYKSHWREVGSLVVSTVQYFFAHGYMLKGWNCTFLVLLPKVDSLESISQFFLIGLCNVLYKCISKYITGRLQLLLPSLVSGFHNAFILGRLLSDNRLLAHEVLPYMNASMARKRFYLALKLDMNKAYDWIRLDFILRALQAFGFPFYWIHIIHQCVSTVSYQVLVNGSPSPTFQP
ncbi:uncharacterized protein LOC110734162 [Chenopodium quinoa]|uniref:uncharacterized protein LOC110734162 n=1 Tax=Chenopodium quinoa TaxID=63459 RepID=UPI000B77A0D9|nr:uncharacterized protein LOC110734162 [Chenopodium quinoa]